MKASFLSLYHERYARPLRDYAVAGLESLLTVLALLPHFFNWWMNRRWVKYVMRHWVGIVDIPPLGTLDLRRELRRRNATWLTEREYRRLQSCPAADRAEYVLLLQDAFTTFYEPQVVLATYDLMRTLGAHPVIAPYFPNGKALVIKGFLGAFRVVAKRNAARLNRLAALGIPMVGIEPAVVLTYRDEYPKMLGADQTRFHVALLQDWLNTKHQRLQELAKELPPPKGARPILFGHCTERTEAPLSQKSWQHLFEAVGYDLELASVGCCGMCGVFGHEAAHVDESKATYAMSWQPRLQEHSDSRSRLVTGHSCRSQVHRTDGIKLRHPVELLLERMSQT